jgi:enterobacterial common antigen flippase
VYCSVIGLLGSVSALGVSSSAVREVVQANKNENPENLARTVSILRRASLAIGVFGWLLAVLLAKQVSGWMFGSTDHTVAIAALGITIFLGAVGAGQLALLQGLGRIGDLARANVLGVLASTLVAIAFYACFGEDGIVPALVTSALFTLGLSYWFSSRIAVAPVAVSWAETLQGMKRLIGLGVGFMWSGVLAARIDMLTRSIITREFGVGSVGIYQAAWGLSGMFAGFILGAMGIDFYPRLTGAIHDRQLAARLVNEQTEVGILLALPGLLGTLAFSPLVMRVLYTEQFLPGAELLPWMVLGVFGRVLSWPMGFIQLAKGASRWFLITESVSSALHAVLLFWLVGRYGMVGAAYAFALTYALYTLAMLWVGRVLIDFRWSREVITLIRYSAGLVAIALAARLASPGLAGMAVCSIVTIFSGVFSLRGLAGRLGEDSKWVKRVHALPGGRWVLGTW